MIHTRSDLEETLPRVDFQIDHDAVSKAGMTSRDVAVQLYTSLNGAPAGTLTNDGDRLPVVVTLELDENLALEQVAALPLFSLAPSVNTKPQATRDEYRLSLIHI